jgi:cytochrome P450
MTLEPRSASLSASRVAQPFPFAYGLTTTENPWESIVPEFCRGPDIVFADGVLHGGAPAWVPRRAADVRRIYSDREHFTNHDMAPFARLVGSDWLVLPLESDPPDHGAYRKILNPFFSPAAVAQLDEKMRGYAHGYVTSLRDRGACDFMDAFAFEFPVRIFLELMAMPQELAGEFLEWEHHLLHSQEVDTLAAATRKVVRYLTDMIQERKSRPGADLVSQVVAGRTEEGRALSDDEILGVCFNLYIGGLDTVSTNLGWQFFHLATHPQDQAVLRADPTRIPEAMDELFRYYAAVTTYRRCTKRYEVAGAMIEPGEFVAMSTTLAARDEHEYEGPNEVVLGRRPRHVSFGYGHHACLGMHLARREIKTALQEVLAVLPEFHLSRGQEIRTLLHSTIQPDCVPLEWNPC